MDNEEVFELKCGWLNLRLWFEQIENFELFPTPTYIYYTNFFEITFYFNFIYIELFERVLLSVKRTLSCSYSEHQIFLHTIALRKARCGATFSIYRAFCVKRTGSDLCGEFWANVSIGTQSNSSPIIFWSQFEQACFPSRLF